MTSFSALKWLWASILIVKCAAQFNAVPNAPNPEPIKVTGSASNGTIQNPSTRASRKLLDEHSPASTASQFLVADQWKSPDGQLTWDLYAYSSDCLGLKDIALVGNYTDSKGKLHQNASIDTITSDYQDMLDNAESRDAAAQAYRNHTQWLYQSAVPIAEDILSNSVIHTDSDDYLKLLRWPDQYFRIFISTVVDNSTHDSRVGLSWEGYFDIRDDAWEHKEGDDANNNSTTPLYQNWRRTAPTKLTQRQFEIAYKQVIEVYLMYFGVLDAAHRWAGDTNDPTINHFWFLRSLGNAVLAASLKNFLQGLWFDLQREQAVEAVAGIMEADEEGGAGSYSSSSSTNSGSSWPFKVPQDTLKHLLFVRGVEEPPFPGHGNLVEFADVDDDVYKVPEQQTCP